MTPEVLFEKIDAQIGGLRPSGVGGWWGLPECLNPDCRKEYHMYFHPEKGFVCHKCGTRGKIKFFIRLLAMSGYDMGDEGMPPPSVPELLLELTDQKQESEPEPSDVPLPIGCRPFNPANGEMPYDFLKERAYDEQLILDMGFCYCTVGRYRQRIIIPLHTLGQKSFLAYEPCRGFFPDLKVMDAEGSKKSNFLFPYDYVDERIWEDEFVVLVEGVTDALRLLQHRMTLGSNAGFPLALLGKQISIRQLDAIARLSKRGHRVIVVRDGDTQANPWSYISMDNVARAVAGRLGRDKVSCIDITRLPQGLIDDILATRFEATGRSGTIRDVDPDDIRNPKHWKQVLEHAESMELALI